MNKLEQLIQELCPHGVEYKKLGEIGVFERGNGLQKSDFITNGYPCIHYGQIYKYFNLSTNKSLSYIPKELFLKLKKAKYNDIIMAITSENIEDVCKAIVWQGTEDVAVGGHTAIFRHNQNAKFLVYYFCSNEFNQNKRKIVSGTKVMEVSPNKLETIKIPLPPLEVQKEIVHILDEYSKLEEELRIALEKELEARKKQFEYYREKLLTFNNRDNLLVERERETNS